MPYLGIGIGYWIGSQFIEHVPHHWFNSGILVLGLCIGLAQGLTNVDLSSHTLELELGIGLGLSSSSLFLIIYFTLIPLYWNWVLDWSRACLLCFFDTPCMFTLELELCIGLAHSLDWPVCWFWSPTSELELGIGSGPSSSRKYVYQSFWHVYPWIGIRYWIGP